MTDSDDHAPPTEDFAERLTERLSKSDTPTDERVYRVALTLHEPSTVLDIAERADCSKNAARRHLNRLTDIGVLARVTEDPATYRRNEAYFEWRRVNRLSNLSDEEYSERLGELLVEDEAYKEKYGVEAPGDLDPLEFGEFGDSEKVWLDLSNWEAIRTEIRDLHRSRNDGVADEGLA